MIKMEAGTFLSFNAIGRVDFIVENIKIGEKLVSFVQFTVRKRPNSNINLVLTA
jgi:hypothetical protein